MSLVVNEPRAFRRAVLRALAEICPSHRYTLTAAGVLVLTPPGPRADRCRCHHPAGCQLLRDLVSHPGWFAIAQTGEGNTFTPPRVFWNPDLQQGGLNARGDRLRPPSIGLAHALFHALDWLNRQTRSEVETSQAENRLRRERCEPRRTHYDNEPVPGGSGGFEVASSGAWSLPARWLRCLRTRWQPGPRGGLAPAPEIHIQPVLSWEEARRTLDQVRDEAAETPP